MMRRRSARIAFEQKSERLWIARFIYLRGIYDRKNDDPAQMECEIRKLSEGAYELVTQGADPGGRRYREFATFDQAREAGEKWAARRFYTL